MPRKLVDAIAVGGDVQLQHIIGFSVHYGLKRLNVDYEWQAPDGVVLQPGQLQPFEDAEFDATLMAFENIVLDTIDTHANATIANQTDRDNLMASLRADVGWVIRDLKRALYQRMEDVDGLATDSVDVNV